MEEFEVVFGDKVIHSLHKRETVDVTVDGCFAGQMVRDKIKRSWKGGHAPDQWEADDVLQSFIRGQVLLGRHLATARREVKDGVTMAQYYK